MKIFFFITIIFSISAFSQSDWQRWEKAEYSYSNPSASRESSHSISDENSFTAALIKSYRFFISDLDGDNCLFHPSCSIFFVQSVRETNLFQGTLMFFDRFTRDMNIFKGNNHYPRVKSGRYFDPPSLYTLNADKINYISSSEVVPEK